MTGQERHKTGWQLYVHPAFSEKFNALVGEVERLGVLDPKEYIEHPKAKLLKRIVDLSPYESSPGSAGVAAKV